MLWIGFEVNPNKVDWDKFGEELKKEYEPYDSRELAGKDEIDFDKKLEKAGKEYRDRN